MDFAVLQEYRADMHHNFTHGERSHVHKLPHNPALISKVLPRLPWVLHILMHAAPRWLIAKTLFSVSQHMEKYDYISPPLWFPLSASTSDILPSAQFWTILWRIQSQTSTAARHPEVQGSDNPIPENNPHPQNITSRCKRDIAPCKEQSTSIERAAFQTTANSKRTVTTPEELEVLFDFRECRDSSSCRWTSRTVYSRGWNTPVLRRYVSEAVPSKMGNWTLWNFHT